MIIYGSKMYGEKNLIRSRGRCEACGSITAQESYDARKWGHIYFIPIFPMGDKVRVLRECISCNRGNHIEQTRVPDLLDNIHDNLEQAVAVLGNGESQMQLGGKTVDALAVVGGNVKDLYCLGGAEEVDLLLEKLRALENKKPLLLAEARLAQVKGELKLADARYQELCDMDPDPWLRFQYATHLYESHRPKLCIPVAEELEQELLTDMNLKQLLLDCYEAIEQWSKLAITYESCFLIVPELKENKKVFKAYKKACKKAGRKVE